MFAAILSPVQGTQFMYSRDLSGFMRSWRHHKDKEAYPFRLNIYNKGHYVKKLC